jgi:hypothetical protein
VNVTTTEALAELAIAPNQKPREALTLIAVNEIRAILTGKHLAREGADAALAITITPAGIQLLTTRHPPPPTL